MAAEKDTKRRGVGRMKKLGMLAVVAFLVVLVMAAPYAAAIEMIKVNGKMINYTKVLKTGLDLWKNRTSEQGNTTFIVDGVEWVLANEPTFSVELKTQLDAEEEDAAAAGVQSSKSGVDPKSIIDTTPDEEKFAGEEFKNALPAPRPPGFEYSESGKDADKGSDLADTQSDTKESVGSGLNAAQAASSEIASTATAAGAKEPEETMKDKNGENKESFFVKVLKWLFGK